MPNPSSPQQSIRAHVFIAGRVQGVGYRYSTMDEAARLGVKGWVRNVPDGRVEAVFEGSRNTVETLIRWCHQGPTAARVKEVEVEYEKPEGLLGFKIER
ncbi:acylphosphatase [Allocoleopsis franciscana]|uniref:acylphosphatase n=1 Tax=Allocoleopsis franciscana PCC 7113 TaxID=1173027 RepID=K9W872_9CYAN|nr:acylphosphatase [Allocoleopsis franciscana]AFZ15969.1 acylphosphatase [Allocoleopsis franciscana PCC 7113]